MGSFITFILRSIFGPLLHSLLWGRRQWRTWTTREPSDSTIDFIGWDLRTGKPLSHDIHERLLQKLRRNQRYGR